jgi:chemotaxis protein CheC
MIALGELEQDALTEIFNIGVGLAADALYQMTGEHVPLSVPVVELTSQHIAQQRYARGQEALYAIRQTYNGAFTTEAVLMFPQESSLALVRMMTGPELATEDLPEVAQDAMAELGNIILNAVISQLASTLGLRLEGTLPTVSAVQADSVLAGLAAPSAQSHSQVLALMIDFQLSAQQVQGDLAFLLDAQSSENLIARLTDYVAGPMA